MNDPGALDACLLLTLVSGFAPLPTRRAIDQLGSPQAVLDADARTLANAAEIPLSRAAKVRKSLDELQSNGALEQEKALIDEHGVRVLTLDDAAYPRLLRLINDPPPVLFVRGEFVEEDAVALGIVGSRRCSHYGREQADRFAAYCAQAGLTIVSGGAYGVDAAAHRAALRVEGRTVAVLGSGIARPYPEKHIELFDQIVDEQRGCVISELPMTAPPIAQNFPARNRIISGLSLGILVIEAALRSGALVTARLAAEDHNRQVLALPGRVDSNTSAGCHKILRDGAAELVTSGLEVLESLGEAGEALRADLPDHLRDKLRPDGPAGKDDAPSLFTVDLTDAQQRIVKALDEPRYLDDLAARTGLAIPALQADLTMLQLRGVIASQGGKWARRKR